MGVDYGRNLFPRNTGYPIQLIANGKPRWLPGNVSIDWSNVVAVSGSNYTIPIENVVVPIGEKYLQYGQVMTRATNPGNFTITVGGTPTGGSFPLTVYNPLLFGWFTVTVLYNSTVAQTQALMDSVFGVGNTVVTGSGALPGNVQTVSANNTMLGQVITIPTATAVGLTGGSPTVTIALPLAGSSYGKFGPYDPNATDGRATISRGNVGILNETVLENGVLNYTTTETTNHRGLLVGGGLWKARVLANTSSATLAAGPLFSALDPAMPLVEWVGNPQGY